MRQWPSAVVIAAIALGAVACGKSPEEKAAEELKAATEKAADAMAQAGAAAAQAGAAAAQAGAAAAQQGAAAGGEAAKGMEEFAKAMQGMATAMSATANGGKAADPVSFRDLQTAFPSVNGWTMDKPRGERMTSPVAFSQTEARYRNGEAQIEVKIVDSAFQQLLVAPWAMFLAAGYEKETDEGYEKSTTLAGHPGFEKWNDRRKSGELNLVVAKRFLVSLEGNRLSDIKQLQDFAGQVDFAKLAGLGKN
ncbi:MAG: hypothetical protein AB7H93_10740 [Vicinamibacterales bacterium]